MFEETPEKPVQEKDPIEILSEVLKQFEQQPLLKKIEKNTSVLPALLRSLTITKGVKAAHMYVVSKTGKPVVQANGRLRGQATPEHAPTSRSARAVGGQQAATTGHVVAQQVRKELEVPRAPNPIRNRSAIPAISSPALPSRPMRTPTTIPVVLPPGNAATARRLPATRTVPAVEVPQRVRAANGRFGAGQSVGQAERERQRSEEPAKGLKAWFKTAVGSILGKGKEKEGDIQDAAGKAAGGPIWEAAKEMQGAAGELRDKLHDEETLLGKSFKWLGKKTGLAKGTSGPPTEGAEQRRHRELLAAVQGHGGGTGGGGSSGGGIADAVEGGLGALVGRRLLSKIPGAGIAARVLAKASPMLSVLAAGTTVAAVGVITAAAAGFAGVMSIVKKGNENGVGYNPTPEQSRAIDPRQTREPSEAEKAKWRSGMMPQGNVVSAVPGATTTVDAAGNLTKRTGDRNWRNNNPGNLEYGPFAQAQGATGSDGRFAVFPDQQSGRKAMGEKLFKSDDYKGKNLSAAIAKWAPASDGNDTASYQKAVLAVVGGRDRKMFSYTPAEQQKIMDAIQQKEGYRAGTTQTVGTTPAKKAAIVQAKSELQEIMQPTSLQEIVPTPLTAQLMGADKLINALNKQAAPKKETATLAPINPHFDDTMLTLMAHDRI